MKLKLSQTAKIMLLAIAGLFAALLLIGLLVIFLVFQFEAPLAFLLGLFIGCALSAAKVFLLEKALGKALDMDKDKAKGYATLQMFLRFGLTVAVLLLAVFLKDYVGLWGIIAGVLTLQLASYIAGFVLRKKP